MADFQPCLAFTLQAEGGYQCDPEDAGNWTLGTCNAGRLIGSCYGISAPVLVAWLGDTGPALTADMMRALSSQAASAIYGAQYWLPCGGPDLPPGVDLMTFDHAVNCGVRRSVRILQTALDVASDGFVGPVTLAAAKRGNAGALIDDLARRQETAYRLIPGAARFLPGWLARLRRRQTTAHGLLSRSVP